ncbi:MFS transporter [Agromyces laixinhei]|uniref:MFS transporter n=1 Tax=Agromyces laixinhei TaxID=2585717 RepID=UPI0012EDE14E|nr:MFS transporter [Agromyces laixinhei]
MNSHTDHAGTGTGTGRAAAQAADPRRWRALTLLGAAQFMLVLDVTVVAVALPEIGVDLGLDRAALTWVVSAYTLLFGGLMLFGGRLADLFGARRVAMTGLATFTAASLVAGLSVSAEMLLVGRVGQGIGAALLSPAALALIIVTFRGDERTKALGVWGALGGTGAAVGVLLGGVLTAGPGWPWVFYVNVPVGLVVLAALPFTVAPRRDEHPRARIDVPGALTVTAATGLLIYGLINAGDHGVTAVTTLGPLAGAVLLYTGFVLLQRTTASPLMDMRLLARRSVAAGTVLMLVATGVLVSGFFLGSFYLQHTLGFDALTTGLMFLPVAVATIIGAQFSSRLLGHLGPRAVAPLGLAVAAAGSAAPAIWPGATALVVGISVAALGVGATFVAAFTSATAQVDDREAGLASGLINTFHELGGAIGVAVVSSIAATGITGTGHDPVGFAAAFTVTSAAAAVTAGLALLLVPAGTSPAGARPHAH